MQYSNKVISTDHAKLFYGTLTYFFIHKINNLMKYYALTNHIHWTKIPGLINRIR